MFSDENDSNEVCLSIKNYEVRSGLSSQIHEDLKSNTYLIKGPMGKGLDI